MRAGGMTARLIAPGSLMSTPWKSFTDMRRAALMLAQWKCRSMYCLTSEET